MKAKSNTILWIIGIVILLVVVAQLPIAPWFAVITKVTCVENTISHWDFDGNALDSNNINNGIPENITYISGKLGQAVEFNTTNYIDFSTTDAYATIMWVKDYSVGDVDYFFVANINGVQYVNGVINPLKEMIYLNIGPKFGLGFNGSVDEMSTFSNLSVGTMLTLYNEGIGREVCYTTTYEENVSCKDYATEQVTPQTTGCLNYTGDFFPNCEYEWETTSGFYVVGDVCEKRFYCEDILISDYSSLTDCEDLVVEEEEEVTTPTYVAAPESRLSQTLFTVPGTTIEVKLIHFIILLIIVVAILYLTKKK